MTPTLSSTSDPQGEAFSPSQLKKVELQLQVQIKHLNAARMDQTNQGWDKRDRRAPKGMILNKMG